MPFQGIGNAIVLQADLYNKLSDAKVIGEAALRSGIPKGAINRRTSERKAMLA